MLRRVLMLVVVWPLLLPPGFCLCRLEVFPPRAAEQSDECDEPAPTCRCCQQPAAEDDSPGRPKDVRPAPPAEVPSPAPPHAPNCPAAPHQAIARVSVPPSGLTDLCSLPSFTLPASWSCPGAADLLAALPPPPVPPFPACCLPYYSCNFRC